MLRPPMIARLARLERQIDRLAVLLSEGSPPAVKDCSSLLTEIQQSLESVVQVAKREQVVDDLDPTGQSRGGVAFVVEVSPGSAPGFVQWGPGLVDLIGKAAADRVERNPTALLDLIHPDDRAQWTQLTALDVPAAEPMRCTFRIRTETGTHRRVVAVAQSRRLPNGVIRRCGVLAEATPKAHADPATPDRAAQLAAVTDAMSAFVLDGDWRKASASLLRSALAQTDSEYGFVGVVVDGPALRILAHEGIKWDEVLGRELFDDASRTYLELGYLEFTNLKNLFGAVITEKRPVVANAPGRDPRSGGLPPGHPTLHGFLGVPLFAGTDVVGLIGIANRAGGYSAAELDKLEILGNAASVLYDSYRRRQHENILEEEGKRTEDRLRFTQFALDHAGDAAFLIRSDARFLYANDTACRSLGYNRRQLSSMSVPDIDSDVPASVWQETWEKIKRLGAWTFESHHRRSDGTTFPVEITASSLDYQGKDYCCAFVRDITERKRAEAELKKAKERAEAASKAKALFLANISHEIRTPITAMLGAAELADWPTADSPGALDRYDVILRNGRHLLSLIDNLLDAARMEAGTLDVHCVHCSLEEIMTDIRAVTSPLHHRDGVSLRVFYETQVPDSIETDPVRLMQAVINLINNALKFTEKGHVHVYVRVERNGPDPRLSIRVEDTGPGIPAEAVEHVFETFTQLESSASGGFGSVGLGLPLTRRIAEALRGTLDVKSTPGVGSSFTLRVAVGTLAGVTWSAMDDVTIPAQSVTRTSHRRGGGRLKGSILLAEDFRDTRELIRRAFIQTGAAVTAVGDGQQALEAYRRERFDLIVLDIRMPVLDGLQTVAALRRAGCRCAVIALTATAAPDERERILKAGFDDIWPKPMSLDQVIEGASAYLETSGLAAAEPLPKTIEPDGVRDRKTRRDALIEEFARSLPGRVSSIRHALANGDVSKARETLHQLVGAGGLHGFMSVSYEAARLLGKTKDGSIDGAPGELATLESLAEEIESSTRRVSSDGTVA